MPKVGNKTFPYTSKGIDDAKKYKQSMKDYTLERRPKSAVPRPKPKPRKALGGDLLPATKMPRTIRPVGTKNGPTFGAVPKPAKRRAVRTAPMKREK
jgi:hypothetical protein